MKIIPVPDKELFWAMGKLISAKPRYRKQIILTCELATRLIKDVDDRDKTLELLNKNIGTQVIFSNRIIIFREKPTEFVEKDFGELV